jgi:hypothetical protein
MKKIVVVFIAIAMSFSIKSQEVIKQKEVGISFQNFDNFGLVFKTGNTQSLWRFGAMNTSGYSLTSKTDSAKSTRDNFGLRLVVGKEFRKKITDELAFVYGLDGSFAFNKYINDNDDQSVSDYDSNNKTYSYRPALNLVLGLNYDFNDKLSIQGEIYPGVTYIYSRSEIENLDHSTTQSDQSDFYYQLSNSSATLTVVYCF